MSLHDLKVINLDDPRWASFDPSYEEAWFRMQHLAPEQVADTLNDVASRDEPWNYLDQLEKDDPPAYMLAKNLIGCLAPGAVAEVFGDEMLLCVALSSVAPRVRDEMLKESEKRNGTDAAFFTNARTWAWQKRGRHDMSYVMAMYDLFESVASGHALGGVDLPDILQANAATTEPLSDKRVAKYGLLPLKLARPDSTAGFARGWARTVWSGEWYGLYIDAPVGFALTYQQAEDGPARPQAIGAISLNSPDELIVTQVQGVKAKRHNEYDQEIGFISARGLAPLNWRHVLVEVAEEVGRTRGYGSIAVQSAQNNIWTEDLKGCEEAHVTVQQIRPNYDDVALARGYELGDDGNYHKQISPSD